MFSTLKEIILGIASFEEEQPIFAERINQEFRPSSKATVLDLSEEELDLPTTEIAALKCPGLDYFLDVFIVQEMMADLENAAPSSEEAIAAVIHYAEYDA